MSRKNEERNVRLVLEHFAAESNHDHGATLATVAEAVAPAKDCPSLSR